MRLRHPGAVLVLFTIACHSGEKSAGRGAPDGGPPAAVVEVAKVEKRAVPVEVRAIGRTLALSSVQVKPQVGGLVTSLHFKDGDEVREGQILAQIDERPFVAALAQARALLAKDRAQAQNAHRLAARYRKLVDKGYVTRQQYEDARAQASSFDAAIKGDEAVIVNAELNVEQCSVRAPIRGKAGRALIDAGNVVKPNEAVIVILNEIRPIRASFAVPGQHLYAVQAKLRSGALAVTAHPQGSPRLPSQGRLVFVDNQIDPTTGTINLEAQFPNEDDALWPGQPVDVVLTLEVQEGALVAPGSAILTGQQGTYAYVVADDGTARPKPVTIDRRVGDEVVVRNGLEDGETVVTDGQLALVPGAKVRVRGDGEAKGAAAGGGPRGRREAR